MKDGEKEIATHVAFVALHANPTVMERLMKEDKKTMSDELRKVLVSLYGDELERRYRENSELRREKIRLTRENIKLARKHDELTRKHDELARENIKLVKLAGEINQRTWADPVVEAARGNQ